MFAPNKAPQNVRIPAGKLQSGFGIPDAFHISNADGLERDPLNHAQKEQA
jgi:hypothetical protein